MAPTAPIFTIQIPSYKSATHNAPEGNIVCTSPAPKIYLLTFTQPPDNRLTPPFLDAFNLALDVILSELPPGVVITTSGITKFYSNGLDYSSAVSDPLFMHNHLYPLWRKLLTYPYPTIALVNGHSFAGGLMTAMAHDYRIMNPDRGFLCLNELDFNAALTPAMASVFRVKLSMSSFRTLILEGKRLNALAGLEAGIVDGVGGLDETLKIIGEMGLTGKVKEVGVGSYGLIKEEMYREIIADLDAGAEMVKKGSAEKTKDREERLGEGKKLVEGWKKDGGKVSVPKNVVDVKAKL